MYTCMHVPVPVCAIETTNRADIRSSVTQIRNYLFAWHDLGRIKSKLGHVSVSDQVHLRRVTCSIAFAAFHRESSRNSGM